MELLMEGSISYTHPPVDQAPTQTPPTHSIHPVMESYTQEVYV